MSSDAAARREDDLLDQYIQKIPKVELHAHLNGCIREETLRELARERNASLSARHFAATIMDASSSKHDPCMYNVLPRSLQDCFDMFAEIPACVNDLASLRRITQEALEDFAAHEVVYLELRSTPKILLKSHSDPSEAVSSKREYIETILSVFRKVEREEKVRYKKALADEKYPRLPMACRFIVSVDRSQSVEEAQENIELAIDFYQQDGSLVVGVDLGGNPTKQDFRLFQPLFGKARNVGLKITLHCAEISCGNDDPENDTPLEKTAHEEAAAILEFGPTRIGHALLLPPSLRKSLFSRRIPVETCPTSNVMTLELAKLADGDLIHGLRQHPTLQHWLETDYPLAVGTDDPGVFSTTATQELRLLAKAFGMGKERIGRLVAQSVEYAFCDQTTKTQVKTLIEQRLNELQP
jgi:adenosine deaminase